MSSASFANRSASSGAATAARSRANWTMMGEDAVFTAIRRVERAVRPESTLESIEDDERAGHPKFLQQRFELVGQCALVIGLRLRQVARRLDNETVEAR